MNDHPTHDAHRPASGPGPTTEDAVTVRSEERLRVGTVNVVVGRARLTTHIVTEEQTFTIPVRRQEVRLTYDAVPEDEQEISPSDPADAVYEVVCHAEQVVFTTRIVPVERVRMVRRVVTTDHEVTEQVRAEQIHVEQLPARPEPPASRRPRS